MSSIQVSGKVTYCGHEFHEFVPQIICAYISQLDLHHGEMTERDTGFLRTLSRGWHKV